MVYPFQGHTQILLLILVCKRDFCLVNLSWVTRQSENTNQREKMMSSCRDIRYAKGLILLIWGGGPPSKSASQSRVAVLFQPWPFLKGTLARRANPRSKRPWLCRIMGSLPLHRAGCSHSKLPSQPRAAELFRPWTSLKGISAVVAHQSEEERERKQPLQTFSSLKIQGGESVAIGIWTQFCSTCRFRERWTRREFLSPLLWKQVCYRGWIMTRMRATSPPLAGWH